jgi:hypothetical protein
MELPERLPPRKSREVLALAIAQMAEQQMALEGRVASAEEVARSASERLDRAALVVGEIGRRLKSVEGRVRPDAYITDEQAAEISLRVKALARLMGGESAPIRVCLRSCTAGSGWRAISWCGWSSMRRCWGFWRSGGRRCSTFR